MSRPEPGRPSKIPRVDLRKLEAGDPGPRRALITQLGDALCELGVVRILGHGIPAGPEAPDRERSGRDLARASLRLLEQYFGLEPDTLAARAATGGTADPEAPEAWSRGLLAVLRADENPALRLAVGSDAWRALDARPEEVVLAVGEAAERLTSGALTRPRLKADDGSPPRVCYGAGLEPGGSPAPLPEFLEAW